MANRGLAHRRLPRIGAFAVTVALALLGSGAPRPALAASTVGPTIVNFAGSPTVKVGNAGDGGPATSATLAIPWAVALDPAGNVYIADQMNNRVRKVDAGGVISNFAGSPAGMAGNTGDGGPATAATLDAPGALAVDSAGSVYVADVGNHRVRKVDAGGLISNVAGSPVGAGGNTGDGGPATSATLGSPRAVAADPAGNLFIVDVDNNRVRRVDAGGIISNLAGSPVGSYGNLGDGGPAIAATLRGPRAVAVDAAGNVYIADDLNNRVRKVDKAGIIANFAGSPAGIGGGGGDLGPASSATLSRPSAVAIDRSGNAYIADEFNNRVRKVDPAGVIVNFAGDPNMGSGNAGDGGPPTSATLMPFALAADPAGNVYIADHWNARVRKVLASPFAAPLIWSADMATFTVGVPASFKVIVTGKPSPTVMTMGPVPDGFTFDRATQTLSGTPTTVDFKRITFKADNGVGVAAVQTFYLTVNQAEMTYPTEGQTDIDTTIPFTWATIPQAQNYYLTVGTTWYGSDLVDSGVLPSTQWSLDVPPLPTGVRLHATLYALVRGYWSFRPITFTAAPGHARFTFPLDGQTGVDTVEPFSWTTVPEAQRYYLIVGTDLYGSDLVNSGVLPSTTSTFRVPGLPIGSTLHATLFAEVGGVWSYQAIGFFAAASQAMLTFPLNGQNDVDTRRLFTWSSVPQAQGYYLTVGTTPYGSDAVNSGLIPVSQLSFPREHPGIALPTGRTLYVTLFTEVNRTWRRFQAITITAIPDMGRIYSPLDGQLGVDIRKPISWSTIPEAQGYLLIVGTTLYGDDLYHSAFMGSYVWSVNMPPLPIGQTVFATLFTEVNGNWTRYHSITFQQI